VAAPVDRQRAEDVHDLFQLNLVAPVELCRQALPGMIRRGRGRIVNISSQSGAVALPGITTYAASKSGLSAFTRGLRLDLTGTGVGTTIVEIGTVATDMLARLDQPGTYGPTAAAFNRSYALRLQRRLPVDEVVTAVVAAVRDDASAVRLPRRAAALSLMAAAPQRIVDVAMLGLRKRA
jgi:short-subunit dehydrogenase